MRSYKSTSAQRLFPAQVYNWVHGINKIELANDQRLTLVDAGIDFNFPIPPLLRKERAINIIIMLDLGTNGKDLAKAAEYAKKHHLKFPKLPENYLKMLHEHNEYCLVLQEDDPSVPVVIYVQAVKANPDYESGINLLQQTFTKTNNFAYSPEQFNALSGLAAHNMKQSQLKIAQAINRWIELQRKHQRSESADAKGKVALHTSKRREQRT